MHPWGVRREVRVGQKGQGRFREEGRALKKRVSWGWWWGRDGDLDYRERSCTGCRPRVHWSRRSGLLLPKGAFRDDQGPLLGAGPLSGLLPQFIFLSSPSCPKCGQGSVLGVCRYKENGPDILIGVEGKKGGKNQNKTGPASSQPLPFTNNFFSGVLLIKGMMPFPVLSQYFLFTYKVKVITLFYKYKNVIPFTSFEVITFQSIWQTILHSNMEHLALIKIAS